MDNKRRGAIGAVANGAGIADPGVMLRLGAAGSSLGLSTQSLYAIAAGGVRR
jgi:hypothetical protein